MIYAAASASCAPRASARVGACPLRWRAAPRSKRQRAIPPTRLPLSQQPGSSWEQGTLGASDGGNASSSGDATQWQQTVPSPVSWAGTSGGNATAPEAPAEPAFYCVELYNEATREYATVRVGALPAKRILRTAALAACAVVAPAACCLFGGPAAALPHAPWSLPTIAVMCMATTFFLYWAAHEHASETYQATGDVRHATEAGTDALHIVATAFALALVFPRTAAGIVRVLMLDPTPLLIWAAGKPAGMLPICWFPISGWAWAVAAGTPLLLLAHWLPQQLVSQRAHGGMPSSPELRSRISMPTKQGSLAGGEPSARALMPHWVTTLVLAPFWEEVLFRGFLLTALASHMPLWLAVAVSSLFFMLAHPYDLTGPMIIFLFSIVMSASYLRTGNLVPAVLLHSLNNAAASSYLMAYFGPRLVVWAINCVRLLRDAQDELTSGGTST